MDKIYLRSDTDSQDLHISFRFTNEELQVDRDFNFCRKMNEKLEGALNRIRGNIEKEFNKKLRKGKKKSPAQVQESFGEIYMEFRRKNYKLEDVTFAEMLTDKDDLTLKILDKTFEVVLNEPWVVNLVLPTSMLAGFPVYASRVEMKYADNDCCRTQWFKAKMPLSGNIQQAKWIYCGEGFFYLTSNEDVGYFLKFVLTPGNSKGHIGPAVEQISKKEIQAGTGPCPFDTRHFFTSKRLDGDSFRVVSYNILADLYADSDYSRTQLFPYCPSYALKVDYRKQLYMKELLGYNADILCLQEVDMKIFDYDLKPVFEYTEGFKGVIAQKGACGEGIATFYRSERFELVETYTINIGEQIRSLDIFDCLWQKIKSNTKLVERICDRSTTLQLNLLKMNESDRYLLVANTHLYFHPDADHIRLLQFGFAMLYIEDVYKKALEICKINNDHQLAVIFCGDFNSVPECGIYRLMTSGFVDENFIDWRSNIEEAVQNVTLRQPFAFKSACGTPDYTNYTHAFAACLDYIFYHCDRLDVEQFIPLPTNEELKAHTAIPSVVFPSDHVALIADIKFKSLN